MRVGSDASVEFLPALSVSVGALGGLRFGSPE